jgi:simple sugar transport system permease protein
LNTKALTDASPTASRSLLRRTLLHPDLLQSLAAILIALLVGAGLITIFGKDALAAYRALLDGAAGNLNSLAETLLKAIPLTLAGIGVSVAFRAGVFNVGAEGQLYIGAMTSAWVGLLLGDQPWYVVLPTMMIAAMLAGALWAGIAGILKTTLGASELINTIMLNYIAIFFVGYLLHGPLQEPNSPLGQTARLGEAARLPRILEGTRLHAGIIIAIIAVVIVYVLLWRTVWGFQIRASGHNPEAAQSAGISAKWVILSSLLVSGALAGLAGFTEVAGIQRRMIENISPGYGYTAIVVALLGRTNPPAVFIAAILFAGLQVGASTMESAIGVPSAIATIIQYLIVLLIIGRGTFKLLYNWRHRR